MPPMIPGMPRNQIPLSEIDGNLKSTSKTKSRYFFTVRRPAPQSLIVLWDLRIPSSMVQASCTAGDSRQPLKFRPLNSAVKPFGGAFISLSAAGAPGRRP